MRILPSGPVLSHSIPYRAEFRLPAAKFPPLFVNMYLVPPFMLFVGAHYIFLNSLDSVLILAR